MSIKYKLIEKVNPQNRTQKKWYATTVNQGTTEQHQIAKNIAEKSSLTSGDVGNTLENLVEEIPKTLSEGKSVKLGDFGSFRISISSEGVDTQDQFNTHLIKKPKIIFTPGKALKEMLDRLSYEKE